MYETASLELVGVAWLNTTGLKLCARLYDGGGLVYVKPADPEQTEIHYT